MGKGCKTRGIGLVKASPMRHSELDSESHQLKVNTNYRSLNVVKVFV
jgi:hypothetical protein